MTKAKWHLGAENILIVFGAFLVLDSLFLHALSFDYVRFGLGSLDPFLDHWMIGLVVIGVAIWDVRRGG